MRGLFLRGNGGKSASLQQRQASSVHIPESAGITITLSGIGSGGYPYPLCDDESECRTYTITRSNKGTSGMVFPLVINSPYQETRPDNMAVRYLMRAKP